MRGAFLLLISCLSICNAFMRPIAFARRTTKALPSVAPRSRLFSSPADDVAEVNALIEEMLRAAPYDLPGIVSRSLKLVSSRTFFLQIAAKSDEAKSNKARDALSTLATTVMTTLEVIVQRTEEKVDISTDTLQTILKAAAEDDGEFLVPLSLEKWLAMRNAAASCRDKALLDESFLSTVNAWMRKSEEGGLSGMVTILQTALQQFAALELAANPAVGSTSDVTSASELLDKVLATTPEAWSSMVAYELGRSNAVCTKDGLLGEIQARIETIVLGAGAGSYAQRVQAEFLRELTERIKSSGEGPGFSVVVE